MPQILRMRTLYVPCTEAQALRKLEELERGFMPYYLLSRRSDDGALEELRARLQAARDDAAAALEAVRGRAARQTAAAEACAAVLVAKRAEEEGAAAALCALMSSRVRRAPAVPALLVGQVSIRSLHRLPSGAALS